MRKFIRKITTSRYYAGIFEQNKAKISKLRDILSDYKSVNTLDNILKAYQTVFRRPDFYFSRILDQECAEYHFTTEQGFRVYGTKNPYFLDDIFALDQGMVYLDGGAYIGDTIFQLCRQLGGACKHIYAFEPNDENYKKLESNVMKKDLHITCMNAGLDNHNGFVPFVKADSGSRVSDEGTESIRVVDINKFLAELQENTPSFIKLDIEGKEFDVVYAMGNFIKTNQPDLAISIYHRLEDLWEIPLLIHELNPNYKIYLRHQSNFFTETVCYATLS